MSHVVFADPSNAEARELEARALEQLGYQAENGTWRNFYLMGALELREGSKGTPIATTSADVLGGLSLSQLFDGIAIRVDGMRAAEERLVLNWVVDGQRAVTTLSDGVFTHVLDATDEGAAATLTLDREAVGRALMLGDLSGIQVEGDVEAPGRLFALLDTPDPGFEIVAP